MWWLWSVCSGKSILDAGYTVTKQTWPLIVGEADIKHIKTWTIVSGSSVRKDWPLSPGVLNEIWPRQRGQMWLFWAGETWAVQPAPRVGETRGPPLSWLLPPSEGQLCPCDVFMGPCGRGWEGEDEVGGLGEQDHRQTKVALPQGALLLGLPRFRSPGQPVHVSTSELKMECRLTSVLWTRNNLGFSLCTT